MENQVPSNSEEVLGIFLYGADCLGRCWNFFATSDTVYLDFAHNQKEFLMEQLPRIISIHPHYQDREFVVLVERNGCQYAITIGTLGRPIAIQAVQGRMMVYHNHRGYGSYSLEISADQVGEDTPMLDLLCSALISKEWSHNLLSLKIGELPYPGERYVFKRAWENSKDSFYISDSPMSDWYSPFEKNVPAWLVRVEMYMNQPHIVVQVKLPELYDKSEALAALLKAINSIPDASSLENIHPAALAS